MPWRAGKGLCLLTHRKYSKCLKKVLHLKIIILSILVMDH